MQGRAFPAAVAVRPSGMEDDRLQPQVRSATPQLTGTVEIDESTI